MKIVIGRISRERLCGIGMVLLLVIAASGGAYAWLEYEEFFLSPIRPPAGWQLLS